MKPIKIKLHSSVDLITNSSTVIFTYSEGAVQAVRELVNEMLKVFGHEDKTFDDLFYAETFLEEEYYYSENNSKFPDNVEDTAEFLKNIKAQVLVGEIEKPD
jgi:transglutaminase-like putative cysteine protease